MKKILLVSFLLMFSKVSTASVDSVLKILPEEVVSAYSVVLSDDLRGANQTVKVYAKVEYGNNCLITDRKLKKMQRGKDYIKYELWGLNYSKKVCPKIYMPVEIEYLVDSFDISNGSILPQIYVNEIKTN